jgi:hypothetical protein
LAKFAAVRRVSSWVSQLIAERRCGFIVEIEIAERLPVVVAADEASFVCAPQSSRAAGSGAGRA